MMSTSLWVRSSSDLMPDSRVMEGLTETGGTGITWRTAHSGLAALGSIPRRIRSSSGILSSLSRTVLGLLGIFDDLIEKSVGDGVESLFEVSVAYFELLDLLLAEKYSAAVSAGN